MEQGGRDAPRDCSGQRICRACRCRFVFVRNTQRPKDKPARHGTAGAIVSFETGQAIGPAPPNQGIHMYQLRDSFNNTLLSNHRTAENAGKAAAKHTRAVKRHNGEQSYCRFELRCNGLAVDLSDYSNGDASDFCRGLNGGDL